MTTWTLLRDWLGPGLVFTATLTAFLPALDNGFLRWDDHAMILDNPHFRGLDWPHIRWMFTTLYHANYKPLNWLSLALDHNLWHLEPAGYHLTSILIHAANAVLFYFVSRRLLKASASDGPEPEENLSWAAISSALLFSLHPLRVESVVWVSERYDVLAGLFYLLTILAYLRTTMTPSQCRLWGALFAYVLALLSKGIVITLPLALLILDIFPLRRLPADPRAWLKCKRILIEKIPFALLALAGAAVNYIAQHQAGAVLPLSELGLGERLAYSLHGLAFYFWKSIAPFGLHPHYETRSPFNPWTWPFLLSAALIVAAISLLTLLRRRRPAVLAAAVFYVVTLLPVLGFVKLGIQVAADRYTYLACLSWTLLGAGALLSMLRSNNAPVKAGCLGIAGLILLCLGTLTQAQSRLWKDSKTLWTHALSVDPQNAVAHNNLATELAQEGRLEEALEHCRLSVSFNPRNAMARANYGAALAKQRRFQEALAQYQEALRIAPQMAAAHHDQGLILAQIGDFGPAIEEFQQALKLDGENPSFHYDLAVNLARLGKEAQAMAAYRQTLILDPDHADARNNLGLLLAQHGKREEAASHFRKALAVKGGHAKAAYNWGNLLASEGRLKEAIRLYQEALKQDPDFVEARFNLANTLAREGAYDEAAKHYRKILENNPKHATASRYLSAVLRQKP